MPTKFKTLAQARAEIDRLNAALAAKTATPPAAIPPTTKPVRKADSIPSFNDNGAGKPANYQKPLNKDVKQADDYESEAAAINAMDDISAKATALSKLRERLSNQLRSEKVFSDAYNRAQARLSRVAIAEAQALHGERVSAPDKARARRKLKASNI